MKALRKEKHKAQQKAQSDERGQERSRDKRNKKRARADQESERQKAKKAKKAEKVQVDTARREVLLPAMVNAEAIGTRVSMGGRANAKAHVDSLRAPMYAKRTCDVV